MASESSSAVLELNDGDVTEDTEPPSVMTEENDGVPLIMEHGYDIAVKVDMPLKQMSTLETFVTYRVRCVCARWPAPAHVRRRYNHFKALHKRLSAAHPLIATPPLPPLHSARQQLDRYSPAFVAVRTLALDAFLDRVAKHPILTHSEDLRLFLTAPADQLERALKPEGLALWGLTGGTTERPANPPRVKDPEFVSAAEYLTSLQHKLTALCALTRALHKGQAEIGHEMMGMKRVCDAWASQAGGRAGAGAGAAGAGAGAAAAARANPRGGPVGLKARATLPLLAAYAAAHVDKIKQRDSLHAARANPRGGPVGLKARATLPLLAAYAAAHVEKIKQRDSLHATYVSGSNTTGELHNRLEQASEALRSELSDWIPKTHAEIKSLLLDIAEKQVSIHKQSLMGWEHALKLSTEPNTGELFKTVSKNAVQNLSPSKYNATPTETEKDFDDISNSSNSNDFEVSNLKLDASESPENYEVVKNNHKISIESEGSKNNGSTESYEVVKDIEVAKLGNEVDTLNNEVNTLNDEVGTLNNEVDTLKNEVDTFNIEGGTKDELKAQNEVHSDPLRDFSDVDLSS